MKPIKVALLGTTGVGKDTCTQIILKEYSYLRCQVIRLADPLYKAQDFIYQICDKKKEFCAQDGELLNFLGKHMRKINPDVLKQSFNQILNEKEPDTDLFICSDARPIDIPFIKEAGFAIFHIDADPAIAFKRRQKRGDITLGNSKHFTEMGISADLYDYQISNNGTFQEFEEKILTLMNSLITRNSWDVFISQPTIPLEHSHLISAQEFHMSHKFRILQT